MNRFSVFLFIAIVACSPKISTFTKSDVERASSKFPGSSKASLTKGKDYYTQYCGNCHPYKPLDSKSEKQWDTIVPKMVVYINKKANQQVVDAKKEKLILAYIVTMGAAPKK